MAERIVNINNTGTVNLNVFPSAQNNCGVQMTTPNGLDGPALPGQNHGFTIPQAVAGNQMTVGFAPSTPALLKTYNTRKRARMPIQMSAPPNVMIDLTKPTPVAATSAKRYKVTELQVKATQTGTGHFKDVQEGGTQTECLEGCCNRCHSIQDFAGAMGAAAIEIVKDKPQSSARIIFNLERTSASERTPEKDEVKITMHALEIEEVEDIPGSTTVRPVSTEDSEVTLYLKSMSDAVNWLNV